MSFRKTTSKNTEQTLENGSRGREKLDKAVLRKKFTVMGKIQARAIVKNLGSQIEANRHDKNATFKNGVAKFDREIQKSDSRQHGDQNSAWNMESQATINGNNSQKQL
ncbi:hypothetical protein TNCV_4333991 [Trichonephila clavipes]|nr:hypothetical protein TNCV_4333991 [Trichonephila clavipes]